MTPKPIFSFDDVNATGLDQVPLNSVFLVESTGKQYLLTNKTSPVLVGAATTVSALLASSGQYTALDSDTTYDNTDFVDLTSDQSIGGVKTFTSSPVVPTVTQGDNSTNVASTAYVDAAVPTLTSGTYTPTLTNIANLDQSTTGPAIYSRVGNVVTVTGYFSMNPTTADTLTVIAMTLPIASNFTASTDCTGVGNFDGQYSGYVFGDTTTDLARFVVDCKTQINNQPVRLSYQYIVQ